jgi:hypothetical protein
MTRGLLPASLLSLCFLLLFQTAAAQKMRFVERRKAVLASDTLHYFYEKGLSYGTQNLINPAYVIANNSFDILQLGGYSKQFSEMDWRINFRNTNDNLLHPFATIRAAGWDKFLKSEVFPLNFTPDGAQWVPNYFLHMLGTGMQYRMMTEWYRAYDVPAPKVFAVLTMLSAQYLNEVVENKGHEGYNLDPIADWYIFNIAGILLFNSTKVSKFFSEKANMADWSFMPTLSFRDYSLQNSGQWFIYKFYFRKNRNWAIFSRWGMGTYLGVTRKINQEHAITLAGGTQSNQYQLLNEIGKQSTISLTWGAFMAWDKNNTPLMTLQLTGNEAALASLNIYPGVVRIRKFSPGIFAQAGSNGTGAFGICAKYSLGFGVGYGW